MLALTQHNSIAIHSLSTYTATVGQLAELPTILDILPDIANTTNTPIGVVGSHKVAGKGYVNTEDSQMAFIGAIFSSTYLTKQLNLWSNSLTSCMVNQSQLSACIGKLFKVDLSTHGHLTSLRNKPQQKQHGKFSLSLPG